MRQVVQDLKNGQTRLEIVPEPMLKPGTLLIRGSKSLVSLGTERMLVEFARAGYLEKALRQPEKVKQAWHKVQTDGWRATLEAIQRKLDQPLPLGYCHVGIVEQIGPGVEGFRIGDRVVSNGHHAEVVCVSQNLAARIPDDVTDEQAVFTVTAAIGLQGIRLLEPTFGEHIVVIGMGLIGLLSAQLLKAAGCRVTGIDTDAAKIKIARDLGLEAYAVDTNSNPVSIVMERTFHLGADGILITATTESHSVISQAAQMCRKKGRIVLVGVIGLHLNRSDFYHKELSFQVSSSYGPGRYDPVYESGIDYPVSYVRWTARRNFEAVLQAMQSGTLQTQNLISQQCPIEEFEKIYSKISDPDLIAGIFIYPQHQVKKTGPLRINHTANSYSGNVHIALIGSGQYAEAGILPHLHSLHASVKYLASSSGLSAARLCRKFKVEYATSDIRDIWQDTETNAVVIATRHHLHARQTIEALNHHKHAWTEKPLALTKMELEGINQAYRKSDKTLTIGFNRRFSPHTQEVKKLLSDEFPVIINMQINAGFVSPDHWVNDLEQGGGRITGELCHFIDLFVFLCSSPIREIVSVSMGSVTDSRSQNVSVMIKSDNGSIGSLQYHASGHASYPKERIEIHQMQKTAIIDNFRKTTFHGFNHSDLKTTQNKGQKHLLQQWLNMLKNGGDPPISYAEIMNVSYATLAAVESLKTGSWINVINFQNTTV